MSRKEGPISSSGGAPNPDRWYTLSLGSSFKDHPQPPPSKFCTLRYEFKPASFDNTQPGTLTKTKDNKVNVEFNNNQPSKPKLSFQGISEDCKENDAVLFFDGCGFRLERLHRAVKRLRHNRLPGESSAAATVLDATSPRLGRPGSKGQQPQPGLSYRAAAAAIFTPPPPQPQQQPLPPPPPPPPLLPPVSVEIERIDIGDPGMSGGEPTDEKPANSSPQLDAAATTPDSKDFDLEAHLDIMNDDDDGDAIGPISGAAEENTFHTGIDINLPHQNDSDDEIADVDVNDDNGVMGGNAAATLRAHVHKLEAEGQTSSSSTSSGSETSGSSSGSGSGTSRSSSDSDSSDGDSVNSI